MRLLVVDDSRTMRSIIASYLRHLGCAVTEAEDGRRALDTLAADTGFDAVLIDWDMPTMNGLDCLRQIRANPEYDGIKTMMVTSQTGMDRVSAALTLGADDYLMKPLDEAMLSDKLRLLGLLT